MSNQTLSTSWSDWLEAVRTQPEQVSALLDNRLGLNPLKQDGEADAIKRAIRARGERVLFIENNSRTLVGYRSGGQWHVRQPPGGIDREQYGRFLEYSLTVSQYLRDRHPESTYGAYYSLRPLIYGGEYWLETVCRQELNRVKESGQEATLSVMVISLETGIPVFELVKSMRKGDRFGYFEDYLSVILPFTGPDETSAASRRIRERFGIPKLHHWNYGDEFSNHFELETRVKKLL